MINKIKDLEKNYMSKICSIVFSKRFHDDLKLIELYIQRNYTYLDDHWDEKNKVKIGIERLIRFHFYTNFGVKNIYPSPLSSDMAIELDDVLLNIDAKTIDMVGNPGDDSSIHFQKNQITFDNNPFFKQSIAGNEFSGVSFPPRLESFHNLKPCITYFITVNYFDDTKTFKLSHLSVCSVPHKEIVKNDFKNNIISNYKTYEYIGKEKATKLGEQYSPKKSIDPSWIPFRLKGYGSIDSYLDPFQEHPFIANSKSVRKKIGGKYQIVTFGGSARIDKHTIERRLDSNGAVWKGVERLKL